ncbi:hypothetical protein K435DRAFT_859561 [Dendrothele bispora CBS 962.96]|uniref:Uncharacterized protein n=1 Tax=Dendrothele bispora (strain CBS 962.96) TaxID=1314807 RepID=A0A4V4HFL7_DENBC|nr:hypothetical protein K435DRAFT_859561 [Dendrothele bispora CBS 962.96]
MAHAQFDPKAMVDFDSLWSRGLFPDAEVIGAGKKRKGREERKGRERKGKERMQV